MRFLALAGVLVASQITLLPTCVAGEGEGRPHVYVVVVDGLDARWLPLMRTLEELRASGGCPIIYPEARAVMPARTNPNHVSLLTGVYPAAHGITGNKYWDRDPEHRAAALDGAPLIEVETFFTIIESETPELRTVGVFGKVKLGTLFEEAPGRQRPPDLLWAPRNLTLGPVKLPGSARTAGDRAVMDATLAALEPESDFTAISLSGLDGASHVHGFSSDAAREALGVADTQIGRLVKSLRERGRWQRSVVLITGDHGFADVRPAPARATPYLAFSNDLNRHGLTGFRTLSEGGISHVYAEGLNKHAVPDADAVARLRAVRRLALRTPGIAEALYRLPVPDEGPDVTLAAAHPSWRISHPRVGDLVLVAEPGVMFGDPGSLRAGINRGNHGGPGELSVPLLFCGGSSRLRRSGVLLSDRPSTADAAATVAKLLGLRPARRLDGRPVSADHRGRPLDAVLAP